MPDQPPPGSAEVVAAVGQLFGQGMLVHISPIAAEQLLGAGDQRIEMQFALLSDWTDADTAQIGFQRVGTVGGAAPSFTTTVALDSFASAAFDGAILTSNAFGGAHAAMLLTHD